MVHFFHKQCTDEAGHLSVKLQKLVSLQVCLWIVWLILGFTYIAMGYSFGTFWVGFLSLAVMFCGFWGAYKRNTGLLIIYLIFTIIAAIFYAIYMILVVISLVWVATCTTTNNYNNSIDVCPPTGLAGVLGIQLILSFFYWIVQIYSCVACKRLRDYLIINNMTHHHHQYAQVPETVIYQQQQPQVVYQQQPVVYQQPPVYQQQPQQPPQYQQFQQPIYPQNGQV